MNKQNNDRILLPAPQAAELLGISERHFHNLNNQALIPAPIRLGRSVRWNRDELTEWAAAGSPPRSRWNAMRDGGAA